MHSQMHSQQGCEQYHIKGSCQYAGGQGCHSLGYLQIREIGGQEFQHRQMQSPAPGMK